MFAELILSVAYKNSVFLFQDLHSIKFFEAGYELSLSSDQNVMYTLG